MKNDKTKVIIVMGPTASGKTKLSVRLAKAVNGEIVSADSRQVYKGMNIGSGKDLEEYSDVTHYLIDIREAGDEFSVSHFQREALISLEIISAKKKVPIICGGSGHYTKALIEDYDFSFQATNKTYTEYLESLPKEHLYAKLKSFGLWHDHHWKFDSKRRISRTIEKHFPHQKTASPSTKFNDLYIPRIYYTSIDRACLKNLIATRLKQRLDRGLITEVKNLKNKGLSSTQLEGYGMEYKWISRYLDNQVSHAEMVRKLNIDISRFAKRQMTFLRYMQKKGHRLHVIKDFESFLHDVLSWLNR